MIKLKTYIVIEKFADRYNNFKIVEVGDLHTPHNLERAELLLDQGFLGEEVKREEGNVVVEDEDGLKKLPGGVYELPNGDRVKGKVKALEALKALQGSDINESSETGPEDNLPE